MTMLAAFLQQEIPELPGGNGLWIGIFLLCYLFVGYCLMQIANKTNTPNGWFGFIPILNYVLMLQIAKKPIWWIILFFIPFVNLIIIIMVLVGICQARGKSGWLVLGMLIPLVNLGVFGYLAFAD